VQDSTGFSTVAYYLGLVQMARLRGKKVMCYAQGFGPLAQAKSRAMARFVMSQASLITFRDENSLALAREIGITRPPIHVTADPVFGLEPPGNERMGPILESEGITGEGHRLGVSVRPWKSGADYAAAVAAAADSFAGRHGARVFLFPFQHSQDMDVCREVASKMKEKARVVEKPYPATVLMGLMGRMSMILGMRLHSLIFSAAQGIPSAGISYDPKVSSMMDLVGLPWVDIDTVSADGLLGMMENAFQAGAGHGLAERTARLKELARKNGELLAGLLQG
jgi:polysaccharide pyruvyl transferase CsaB